MEKNSKPQGHLLKIFHSPFKLMEIYEYYSILLQIWHYVMAK